MSVTARSTAELLSSLPRCLYHHSSEVQDTLSELTVLQLHALLFIKATPQASMGDLAKHLNVSPASATNLVERLVKHGWLERHTEAGDRRMVHLLVPPEQAKRLQSIRTSKLQQATALLDRLPPEELHELHHILLHLETLINHKENRS